MDPTISIDGEAYYTVSEFANMTHRTEQSVRRLIAYGNRVRKLRVLNVVGRLLVPAAELTEFPFTTSGARLDVYHYDVRGRIVERA